MVGLLLDVLYNFVVTLCHRFAVLFLHSESCPSGKAIHLTCNEAECGMQGHMPRVVNGRNALPGEVPWVVSISHPLGDPTDHYCGGALIANNWVITAGHCAQGFPQPKVLLGTTNLTADHGFVQVRQVKRSIEFPTYSNYNLNDIALLELEVPVAITDRVRPVCLPPRDDSHLTEAGMSATVSGWGGTIPFSKYHYILRQFVSRGFSVFCFTESTEISAKTITCKFPLNTEGTTMALYVVHRHFKHNGKRDLPLLQPFEKT